MTRALASQPSATQKPFGWSSAVAIVIAAMNLRTAVTSVGPLLDELQRGIGMSAGMAGLLTSLPVLCFAAIGVVTPSLARRIGPESLLITALSMMTLGLGLRPFSTSGWMFVALSVPALSGGAMGNVLLPAMVKRRFPDAVGPLTAAYTTALALGTTLAAALTVPLAGLGAGTDWRLGLGAWAVLSAAGAGCWIFVGRGGAAANPAPARHPFRGLRRSPTAWALALFFGSQSMQAFVAFGWFAEFLRERAGISPARAGLLVAGMSALSIPVSAVVPSVAARLRSQRPLVAACLACYIAAYAGLWLAPTRAPWAWALFAGLASGAFPLALTLIGLRTRAYETTAALSAFSQSIGYAMAGVGPLLVGVLHGVNGGWSWPFLLLLLDLLVLAVSGWYAAGPRLVDDDLRQTEY